ncbi:hypothetical protein [Rhodopirellula sp. P2]|uniref:hypothetical protein n=1 Tax=Rhodopirellula sp. P2 TaxID=2127060 RepID=UPI002368AA8D|nr:hypothetical protein [Rhodopirellula sp. P2]WDQ15419.1 hypothetical protein PSR62_17455 [Rhodopirellula sp. P2]
MPVPEHLWRFPTADAIANLAAILDVPNHPSMQDWEWEIADSSRIDEYLALYRSGGLTNDERFTLMETIIQAFDDLDDLASDDRWPGILALLDQNIDLHAYSVWYWADLEDELGDEGWQVTQDLRKLVDAHVPRLAPQDDR